VGRCGGNPGLQAGAGHPPGGGGAGRKQKNTFSGARENKNHGARAGFNKLCKNHPNGRGFPRGNSRKIQKGKKHCSPGIQRTNRLAGKIFKNPHPNNRGGRFSHGVPLSPFIGSAGGGGLSLPGGPPFYGGTKNPGHILAPKPKGFFAGPVKGGAPQPGRPPGAAPTGRFNFFFSTRPFKTCFFPTAPGQKLSSAGGPPHFTKQKGPPAIRGGPGLQTTTCLS